MTIHTDRLSIIHGPTEPSTLTWTFNDLIDYQAQNRPDAVAIISQQQDRSLTYNDLRRRSNQLAAGLAALGLAKGDRVAVMLGNRIEYAEIFLACSRAGAYVTLINYAYSIHELIAALASTGSKFLLTTLCTSRYNYASSLQSIQAKLPSLEHVVILDDISNLDRHMSVPHSWHNYHKVLASGATDSVDGHSPDDTSCHDILNLQFTSGSTGAPKAASLTHFSMMNSARYLGMQMRVTDKDIIAVPVPLFHAFGLIMGLCMSLTKGATTVLPSEYFDARSTLQAVEKYRCTGIYGVTTMFVDELSHPDFSRTDRSSLRFGIMAGSAMPAGLLTRVMTEFPVRELFTNWGMTELSSVVTMTSSTDPVAKKMATAGRLLPHFAAKIVDPATGKVLPWGQRGEIVVSGFGVMHSYYNDVTRTNQTIKTHDGDLLPGQAGCSAGGGLRRWLHTGDEGYLDEEGYFVITGRIKDLIIRGGENISPLEIEARLYQHGSINQAVVFGVPSERFGEAVAAILELKNGVTRRPSDNEVRQWVQRTLARFKVPAHIWWLGDSSHGVPAVWPKTANGKLRKVEVKRIGEDLLKAEARTAAGTHSKL